MNQNKLKLGILKLFLMLSKPEVNMLLDEEEISEALKIVEDLNLNLDMTMQEHIDILSKP